MRPYVRYIRTYEIRFSKWSSRGLVAVVPALYRRCNAVVPAFLPPLYRRSVGGKNGGKNGVWSTRLETLPTHVAEPFYHHIPIATPHPPLSPIIMLNSHRQYAWQSPPHLSDPPPPSPQPPTSNNNNVQRITTTTLSMAPRFDKTAERWFTDDPEEMDGLWLERALPH